MQTKSLYISSLEPGAGSLIVSMGLMEMLKIRIDKVAFFRPVIPTKKEKDGDIIFMLEHFALSQEYDEAYGFCVDEVESMVAKGKTRELIEQIIDKFQLLSKHYDFILCEGLSSTVIQL